MNNTGKIRTLWDYLRMDYGPERRESILYHVKFWQDAGHPGLPINNKYQMSIQKDKDLKYLIKKKKLEVFRPSSRYCKGRKDTAKRQSYLRIKLHG